MPPNVPPFLAIPFTVQRLALVGGVQTEVIAPFTCQSCTIGNATGDDVRLCTDIAGMATDYLIINHNFERVIWLPRVDSGQFRRGEIGFWLQAVMSGDVVLMWA